MILQKELDIYITGRNKNYYKNKGYEVVLNSYIPIKNEDVNPNSHVLEKRKCDRCGEIYEKTHQSHIKTFSIFDKDLCPCCAHNNKDTLQKRKATCNKKYGVNSIAELESVKEKRRKTCVNKFGVDNPMKNKEVVDKGIKTKEDIYGKDFGQKIFEKAKSTFVQNYGEDNPSKIKEFQDKKEQTSLEHYGTKSPLSSKEIREKISKTNLNKFGVENPLMLKSIQNKCKETLSKNGTVKTSSQQLKIYNLLLKEYGEEDVQLNYPISVYNLDICLVSEKIDIEYDGSYWHQDSIEKDKQRDNFLINNGYRVIRISSKRKIPDKETIIEAINSFEKYIKIEV